MSIKRHFTFKKKNPSWEQVLSNQLYGQFYVHTIFATSCIIMEIRNNQSNQQYGSGK